MEYHNGAKIGYLTLIKLDHTDYYYHYFWLCKCKCGKEKIVRIERNRTKSCGCLQREMVTKHGMETSRFYHIWQRMKQRCYDSNSNKYYLWGGKGIKVTKDWLDFTTFYGDMYKSYQQHCSRYGIKNTTLDRINNNRNYRKNNCRWATYKEQNNNRNFTRACLTHNSKKFRKA